MAKNAPAVPQVLDPWKEWVLHGKEEQVACIPMYNNAGAYQCAWPSELHADLNSGGGKFTQSWQIFWDTWVPLPGGSRYWPADIKVNGDSVVVLKRGNAPGVFLKPGSHTITGTFSWSSLPEYIPVPSQSGLVFLTVNNKIIPFPEFDGKGRLWLKRDRKEEKIENRLKIETFRLVHDSIPARIEVYVSLDVAGSARQVTLGPVYSPDNFTPVSLKSPLPVKLEQDGKIKIQVRPGRFNLKLDIRHSGPLKTLAFTEQKNRFWPGHEIWSFKAEPDLRLVEIKGVPPIDPVQTPMPASWRKFPAYMMGPGSTMTFKEIKRGDPEPAPDQLVLDRALWLRFDGTGYTIQDRIRGTKNTNWRLEMDPAVTLGRVAVDGREQLITRAEGSDRAGIELRNGQLDFTAESTFAGGITKLPVTGWDHDFQQVSGQLYLPPGWKLIHASGMDHVSRTWVRQWTLLDFFIVLIFTIALAKLYSKKLACIAFLAMLLVFHEPNAPRYIWLVLLAGFALLKYLPDGRFRRVVTLCQGVAVLAFIVIVIPYSIQALRIGFYPQLAQPRVSMGDYRAGHQAALERPAQVDTVREMAPMKQKVGKPAPRAKTAAAKLQSYAAPAPYEEKARVMQYDPKALTQTGPGLPAWRPFETVRFGWSGPVTRDQTIRMTLIGPTINLALAIMRVLFIVLLVMGMFNIRYSPGSGIGMKWFRPKAAAALVILLILFPAAGKATEIPTQDMLNQLEKRLLEKDACFPACATVLNVDLDIRPDRLSMTLRIDAQVDTAVPLPGNARYWLPGRVVLDGQQTLGLFRKKDHLWLMVPQGRHVVGMSGPVRMQNAFQVPFNLKPQRLAVKAEGWAVDGVHADGTFDTQLQFKRVIKSDNRQKGLLETGVLPPFARVERVIRLGLVWKVITRVQRISPSGSGMVLEIPLLPGESVTTRGIRVKNNVAKINFRADQTQLVWESFLEKTGQIRLEHPKTEVWTEVWKVEISPIFHMEYQGAPVIFHKAGTRWYPTWQPWPGETVVLDISRPPGVEGQTLTIEKSRLELWPGRSTTRARMDLAVKSSQGGQHTVTLPEGAKLQEVRIKGKIHPVRQNGRKVTLPVVPGGQKITMSWIMPQGMSAQYKSPQIDLGIQSVNPSVDIHLPENRWPLFIGGEQLMGPAVLFWSILIIVLVMAFGLSRTGWASLKFYHWILLCLGMSMSHIWAGIFVVAWLITLDFRKRADDLKGGRFNLVQTGVVLLTFAAVVSLVIAVSNGLLGHPDMSIRGNGSSAGFLRWYHDVSGPVLPTAWVISIPMLAYRVAMLAWALWVSFWLTGVLKWGWQRFSTPVIWQKVQFRRKKKQKQTSEKGASSAKDHE